MLRAQTAESYQFLGVDTPRGWRRKQSIPVREPPSLLQRRRFDYVIPIGLPDKTARESIWHRYIPQGALDSVDVSELVKRTDGFSPADIEFAARKAAQKALESAVYQDEQTPPSGPTTEDYLWAIGDTRMTVSGEMVGQFLEDIDSLARL